jgi:hypothetical protein
VFLVLHLPQVCCTLLAREHAYVSPACRKHVGGTRFRYNCFLDNSVLHLRRCANIRSKAGYVLFAEFW